MRGWRKGSGDSSANDQFKMNFVHALIKPNYGHSGSPAVYYPREVHHFAIYMLCQSQKALVLHGSEKDCLYTFYQTTSLWFEGINLFEAKYTSVAVNIFNGWLAPESGALD